MYNQIIYFLIVLFIFSFQDMETQSLISTKISITLFLLQFVIFYIVSRKLYEHALEKVKTKGISPLIAAATAENILNIIAIVFLVFLVFGIQIGRFFKYLPLVSNSTTLTSIVGLSLYFVYLIIIWYHAFKFQNSVGTNFLAPRDYIKYQTVLYIGILLPWLFLSFFSEIMENFLSISSDMGEIVTFTIGIIMFVLFGPALVIRIWKCKPIPYTPKRQILEDFCRENSFRVSNMMFWPLLGGQTLTAAIVGFIPPWRYILITPALYDMLEPEELKAVIAHEMGHIKHYHMPFYLAFFVVFSLLLYSLSDIILAFLLSNSILLHMAIYAGTFGQTIFALVCTIPFLIILILYFRILFGYFMRQCERQADLFAVKLTKTPWPLISSFQKIALASGNIEDVPSWHHYSIRQRIDFLKKAYFNPPLGMAHETNLKKSIAIFFIAVFILSIVGIFIKKSNWYLRQNINVSLNIIAHEMKQHQVSPEIYASYGGYLTQKKAYKYAELILEQGAKAYPNNPEILNNLAWFYATAPPPFRSPEKAITLALKAVQLDHTKPYIWDTLAEAYYSKGQYRKALEAINKAIELEKSKYYLNQKKKILKALESARGI